MKPHINKNEIYQKYLMKITSNICTYLIESDESCVKTNVLLVFIYIPFVINEYKKKSHYPIIIQS